MNDPRVRFGFCLYAGGKVLREEFDFTDQGRCRSAATSSPEFRKASVALLLRDSGGSDHPDNAGKYFLHQILR